MSSNLRYIGVIVLLVWIVGCGPGSTGSSNESSQTLNVFAAASLTGAFTEIGKEFEAAHAGVKVVNSFAGSQDLVEQMHQGAPADVFASADEKNMQKAVDYGLVDQAHPKTFVRIRLVIVTPKNDSKVQSLTDLASKSVKVVLASEDVPVGSYALKFLEQASRDSQLGSDYKQKVLANVVSYEDNVKAVLQKVVLGEADAGVVYSSDAATAPADKLTTLEIPDEYNVVASYPIAVVKTSKHADLAEQYVEFVLSDKGQSILKQYGFIPVGKSS